MTYKLMGDLLKEDEDIRDTKYMLKQLHNIVKLYDKNMTQYDSSSNYR